MAVNESRSLNRDLQEGLTDGILIKNTQDRGGETEYVPTKLTMNEQHGNTDGDAYVDTIASRVYGDDQSRRSGNRAY